MNNKNNNTNSNNKKEESRTKLVIFDYDGVIANSFTITCMAYEIIARIFNKDSLLSNEDAYRDLFETDWRISLERMGITDVPNMRKAEDIFRTITKRYKNTIVLYPGIEEVIRTLKLKYKLAIVSNNREQEIRERLEEFNLDKQFDVIFDISHGKKPEIVQIQKCLAHFNITPEETVMIGDMDGDVMAARRAGLKKVIAVTYGYHPKHKLHLANTVVDTPMHILGAVE